MNSNLFHYSFHLCRRITNIFSENETFCLQKHMYSFTNIRFLRNYTLLIHFFTVPQRFVIIKDHIYVLWIWIMNM